MTATMSQGFFAQFRSTAPNNASSSFNSDITADMPSRKRSRDTDDIDGDTEVERATSSFRQSVPKRSRVALAAENGGSVVSDDEDELDGYGYGGDSGFVDGLQSDSDEEIEDEEELELRATQLVTKHMKQYRENVASEQGVIEEVFCRNFMCHSKLRIKLGPLINFIIGHNGSGKSAVLTALTMCLGGSAKVTNRGNALKNLIKEGEESATLAVRIKNRGDGAYKPELYGPSIIVERHFSRSGTSGFKIKSASDKTISSKKADLDDILDFFAFQLDNPINVLTQDMARQFLSNSSPTDKYKFFIRGTQLETLDHDYKTMEDSYDGIIAKLQSREEDIAVLKGKFDAAEAKRQRLEKAGGLRERIEKLKNMHAWAQVEEQERLLEQYEQEAQNGQDYVTEKETEAETASGTYDGHDQALEAAQRTVASLNETIEPLKEELATHKTKFGANKAELISVKDQQRQVREDIRKLNETIKEIEEKVKQEQDRIAGAEGAEHTARLEELEQLKHAAEQAKAKQEQHLGELPEVQRKRQVAFEAYEKDKPHLERQKDEVRNAENMLSTLKRSQPRPFAAFPNNMDQLVRMIDRETRFRVKPVGPMGKHVQLLKPEWTSLIEKTFGNALESFVVTSIEDQRLLKDVMQRARCTVAIFVGDPTPLTNLNEPEEGIDTILRVLKIDNDLVRNQLIINQGIEQVLLIPNFNNAREYLFEGSSRPQYVKAALSHGTRHGAGTRQDYSRTGAARSSPMHPWQGRSRMQTNHADEIRLQEENVNELKRDLDEVERRVREKRDVLGRAGQEEKKFERRAADLKIQRDKAQDAVEEQDAEIENMRPQDGKLQEYERQLAAHNLDRDGARGSFQDAVNEQDGLNEKQTALKAEVDAAQRKVDDAERHIERAQGQKDSASDARRRALFEKNEALNSVETAKKRLTKLEERRDTQKAEVQSFVEQATIICHRVEVRDGYDSTAIDNRIEKLTDDLKQHERAAGGSREEIEIVWNNAKAAWTDAVGSLASMTEFSVVSEDTHAFQTDLQLTNATDAERHHHQPQKALGNLSQTHGRARPYTLQLPPQRTQLSRQGNLGPPGPITGPSRRAGPS